MSMVRQSGSVVPPGVSVLADARRARGAGAKVVIVNVHEGDDNVAESSSFRLSS
jgi:hypothetical protein